MKFYGDLNCNRIALVDMYKMKFVNDVSSAIGFINKKGMLFEYAVDNHTCSETGTYYRDCSQFKKRKYKKETYYMGVHKSGNEEYYVVYKVLPRIANDGTFKWKKNERYDTLETVIIQGNFEFTCIVKSDGDAYVDVRYAKCDNKHRNRVTIARIEVFNAANEEILNAIEEWKKTFVDEIKNNKPELKLAV